MNITHDQRIRGRRGQLLRRLLFQQQPLCVECQKHGRIRLATDRDHIVALCNGGKDTFSNTQALCASCHEQKTARDKGTRPRLQVGFDGWKTEGTQPRPISQAAAYRRMPTDLPRSRIPLTMVCGPPGSGKSTYIQTHATPKDVVIDLDAILQRLSGRPIHAVKTPWLGLGLVTRNNQLRALSTDTTHTQAWFIIACPDHAERTHWATMLGAKLVLLDVPADICKQRIANDPLRQGQEERMYKAVDQWWAQHTQGAGHPPGVSMAPGGQARSVPDIDGHRARPFSTLNHTGS